MTPFVLIADIDKAVMDVTMVVVKINTTASPATKYIGIEHIYYFSKTSTITLVLSVLRRSFIEITILRFCSVSD